MTGHPNVIEVCSGVTSSMVEETRCLLSSYVVFEREAREYLNYSEYSLVSLTQLMTLTLYPLFERIRLECYEILNSRFALEHRYFVTSEM